VQECPQKYKRVHVLIENDFDTALMNSQKSIVLEIINLAKMIFRTYKPDGNNFFYGNLIKSIVLMMDASNDSDIVNSCKYSLEIICDYNEFREAISLLISLINQVVKRETIEILGDVFYKQIDSFMMTAFPHDDIEEIIIHLISFFSSSPQNKNLNLRLMEVLVKRIDLNNFLQNTENSIRNRMIKILNEINNSSSK
jgi:hypothetical protein